MTDIDDFIFVADDVCPPDVCEQYIELFKIMSKHGKSYGRNVDSHLFADDTSVDITQREIVSDLNLRNHMQRFDDYFWAKCYKPYAEKYKILSSFATHKVYQIKIQCTLPGEGYHVWHAENMNREISNRLMTFILYLNDIEEGGETEFLYQHRRIKPKMGTCALWPATYTHPHRGNPPLKGEKYILTGWVEY